MERRGLCETLAEWPRNSDWNDHEPLSSSIPKAPRFPFQGVCGKPRQPPVIPEFPDDPSFFGSLGTARQDNHRPLIRGGRKLVGSRLK